MGDYSSGDEASLPGTSANLDHVYDGTDLANVGTNDTNYVNQTGSAGYELHQYKDSITATSASVTWIGKSSLAPSSSKVQLQVYKVAVPAGWQDVSGAGASNNAAAADTDFTLSGTIATADYLDSGVTTFRIYQASSSAPTIIHSYTAGTNTVNVDSNVSMYQGVGFEYAGADKTITSIEFQLRNLGLNGTGDVVYKIYNISGSHGTPTTEVAATAAFNSSSLSGTATYVKKDLQTPFLANSGTTYIITVEYTGSDESNFMTVGTDTTNNPSTDCLLLYQSSTWTNYAGNAWGCNNNVWGY